MDRDLIVDQLDKFQDLCEIVLGDEIFQSTEKNDAVIRPFQEILEKMVEITQHCRFNGIFLAGFGKP